MICNVRIDDRLIHGQTAAMWLPFLKIERVVIVSDEIAHDETRKSLLKIGCPSSTKLSVFTVDSAVEKLNNHIDEGINVMLLFNSPEVIVDMIKKGYKIDSVTVGNLSNKEGSRFIRKTIFVNDKEKEAFLELDKLGVKLISQMVPKEAKDENIIDDIRKA